MSDVNSVTLLIVCTDDISDVDLVTMLLVFTDVTSDEDLATTYSIRKLWNSRLDELKF